MNQTPYTAKQVANAFIRRAWAADQHIGNMKLQKLIYFAHGWSLGARSRPLIDELIQAWAWGPVVPSVYHEFKEFGANPIMRYAYSWDRSGTGLGGLGSLVMRDIDPADLETNALIDWVWERYGSSTAAALSRMTHETNSPWHVAVESAKARHQGRLPRNVVIDDGEIARHFNQLATQAATG